jgi:uncharacterized protein (DUF362 family)
MMAEISRRQFVKLSAASGAMLLTGLWSRPQLIGEARPEVLDPRLVVVAEGKDAARNVEKGLKVYGGMTTFVKKGDVVVVKPNIAWNKKPAQAANTSPEVVAQVVKECLKAGAGEVKVFDRPCELARRTYRRSGIKKAAEEAGAKAEYVKDYKFREQKFPDGCTISSWPLYGDALDADVFINVPRAKDHDTANLTIAMKNLMGIMGGERGSIHRDIHDKLVDLNLAFRPTLNIIDASSIMIDHGPQGASPEDVVFAGKIIIGVNAASADACAAGRLPFKLQRPPLYLANAQARGLGETDVEQLYIETVKSDAVKVSMRM